VQRYLCTTSSRKASIALLVSGAVIFVQFVGFLFIGVLLFAYYRPYQIATYMTGPAAAPFRTSDQVFPDFIVHHLPSGIAGLLVAAVLAAATSPSVNSIAATAVNDLYHPLVRDRSDEHYLKVSRLFTVLAGLAQISVALVLAGSARAAVDMALSVSSFVNSPILGVFLLASTGRGKQTAALAGMIAGIAAVIVVWRLTPAWPWYAVVGSLTTLGVGSVVAMMKSEVRGQKAEG